MRAFFAASAAVITLSIAGCTSEPKTITVEDAVVRLPAVQGRPGAAYFTLKGGPVDATLMSVSSSLAIRAELHETMGGHHSGGQGGHGGGMMSMMPIASLPVPAGAEIKFAPGGKHVMLYDINPSVKPGARIPITLTFTSGQRVTVNANAVAAGTEIK